MCVKIHTCRLCDRVSTHAETAIAPIPSGSFLAHWCLSLADQEKQASYTASININNPVSIAIKAVKGNEVPHHYVHNSNHYNYLNTTYLYEPQTLEATESLFCTNDVFLFLYNNL